MNSELLKEPNLERWLHHPVSELSHHGAECCDRARRHFLSTYAGRALPHSCDRWSDSLLALLEDFRWGCSPWPLHWCALATLEQLDCGALAALSREILGELGVTRYPAQTVQRVAASEVRHYRKLWGRHGAAHAWLGESHSYHELCLIEGGAGLPAILFDSTSGSLIDDTASGSLGGIVALRAPLPHPVSWAGRELRGADWHFFP